MGISGVSADNQQLPADVLQAIHNLTKNSTQVSEEDINLTRNITGISLPDVVISSPEEKPEVFSGTEHPNVETEVKSSTPSGNPLIPQYAQGGVIIDLAVSQMEGRGTDGNVSSTLSMTDHTSAFGYIKTIQKDFRYMSSVDPSGF